MSSRKASSCGRGFSVPIKTYSALSGASERTLYSKNYRNAADVFVLQPLGPGFLAV